MQIPRQQFALKNSSSECQGKSLRGFVCLISGKLSKCGQAAISSNLGWDGRSCLEWFSNHFHGSSDQEELWRPVRDLCGKPGKRGGSQSGIATAELGRRWAKLLETVRGWFENMIQTCWKAEQEMSGNAKGWSLKNRRRSPRDGPGLTLFWQRKIQGSCLSLWSDTSPSCAVKSVLLTIFFATGFQVKKKISQSFPRKQKLMLPQQLQPPLAKFCSGTNRSLPSAVYFQLSKLVFCACDPFSVTENFMGRF